MKICSKCEFLHGEDESCPQCSGETAKVELPDQQTLSLTLRVAGQFSTFRNWVNTAQKAIGGKDMICVDSKGRRCLRGKDMQRARDEGAFPVYYGNEFIGKEAASPEDEFNIGDPVTFLGGRSNNEYDHLKGQLMIVTSVEYDGKVLTVESPKTKESFSAGTGFFRLSATSQD